MYFSGFRGNMELTDALLKIDRKGEGEHSIPLSQIVSVIVKKPGLTSNGLIHIQTVASQGTSATKTKIEYMENEEIKTVSIEDFKTNEHIIEYSMDMNTVFFTKSSYQEALAFKDAIENAITKQNESPASVEPSNLTSQLKELKELLEQGFISKDDYEKKKNSILGL